MKDKIRELVEERTNGQLDKGCQEIIMSLMADLKIYINQVEHAYRSLEDALDEAYPLK